MLSGRGLRRAHVRGREAVGPRTRDRARTGAGRARAGGGLPRRRELHLGVDGRDQVYLDLTHLGREKLEEKLKGVVEIYEKFVGDDPARVPMKVFPGMHYSMGGLWVDYEQRTSIPGLYAAGECEYQYHGANRLGANSLVSCIFGGFTAGPAAVRYANAAEAGEVPSSLLDSAVKAMETRYFGELAKMDG